jgi:hypothetical protein
MSKLWVDKEIEMFFLGEKGLKGAQIPKFQIFGRYAQILFFI